MKTIYNYLKSCGYTRKEILNIDKEDLEKIKEQTRFARLTMDQRLELSI